MNDLIKTKKQLQNKLKHNIKMMHDPNCVYEKIDQELNKFNKLPEKDKKDRYSEINELVRTGLRGMTLDNYFLFIDVLPKEYHTFFSEFCNELNEEFECIKPSEKSLVTLIVSSYVRYLIYSKQFFHTMNDSQMNANKSKYASMLSMEVDRSFRQYTSAYTLLKQIKSPFMSVQLKAETAIMANNQQLNFVNKVDEINKGQ